RLLGQSVRTLDRRLQRGKERLRARLSRRGLGVSDAMLAAELAARTAPGAAEGSLGAATAHVMLEYTAGTTGAIRGNAGALAEEGLRTMFVSKLKAAATVLLAVALLGSGMALVAPRTGPAPDPAPPAAPAPAEAAPQRPPDKAAQAGGEKARAARAST